jgi:hypothetical protein
MQTNFGSFFVNYLVNMPAVTNKELCNQRADRRNVRAHVTHVRNAAELDLREGGWFEDQVRDVAHDLFISVALR